MPPSNLVFMGTPFSELSFKTSATFFPVKYTFSEASKSVFGFPTTFPLVSLYAITPVVSDTFLPLLSIKPSSKTVRTSPNFACFLFSSKSAVP